MAIFNGRYRWDGTKKDNLEPIAWFPGSYDMKILALPVMSGKVRLLKPYICLYARTGEGQSISANPEKFAKRICKDFSLDIERVLWVEDLLTETDRYEVTLFTLTGTMGSSTFYRSTKRQAFAQEVNMIQQALAAMHMELPNSDKLQYS